MSDRMKKICLLVLVVVACAVIGECIVTQPILNRGIVIGVGIDKTETDEIEVTAQLAVAGESSAPGAPNRYALVSGKGATLLSALDDLARVTAYTPAYFHCHMVLFGEKLATEGVREVATQLFIEDSMMDDVAVMATKGSAKDTLKKSVSMQGASSVYLQQLNKINSTGGHPTATLKSFIIDFESAGFTPYIPWVEAVPVPKAVGGADTGGDEQNYVFDCGKTVLFREDGSGIVTEADATTAMALTEQPEGISLSVRTEEGAMDLSIKKALRFWHIEKDGGVTFKATYYVSLTAQNIVKDAADLEDEYITAHVKEHIESLLKAAHEDYPDTDPYSVKGRYYKKYGKRSLPEKLSFRTEISVKRSDV